MTKFDTQEEKVQSEETTHILNLIRNNKTASFLLKLREESTLKKWEEKPCVF